MPDNGLPRLVLLIANERTGTHAFRSAMVNSGKVAAPGEICNAEAQQLEPVDFSYFAFRRYFYTTFPGFSLPTFSNQIKLMEQYFIFFRNAFRGSDVVICDIKYSQLHNFNHSWWDIFSVPDIIQYANSRNISIIHLVRRKVHQTAFSEIYATETGLWRTQNLDDIIHRTVTVDKQVLTTKADNIRRRMELVSDWLAQSKTITIDYETFNSCDGLALINKVNAFLDLPPSSDFHVDFVKTTPAYESIVENYEEIAPLLTTEVDI